MLKKSQLKDGFSQLGRIVKSAPDGMKVYHLVNGEIRASSNSMMGGAPIDFEGEFCVASEPFEKAINALGAETTVEMGKRTLQFISGKSRLALPRLEVDTARPKPEAAGVILELDRGFNELAKSCTSVINEARVLDWQSTLIVSKGYMIGMDKGQLMVCARYEPFAEVEQALIPLDLVDTILNKRVPVREVAISDNSVLVEFQDDSWVHGQMVVGTVPVKVFELLSKAEECEFEITSEQREAISQAASLDATTLLIEPERMTAETANGELVIEVGTPGITGKTRWAVKQLHRAAQMATHWDLRGYPQRGMLSSAKLRMLIAAQMV